MKYSQRTQFEIDAATGIANLVLNRPEALNAFDLTMFEELDAHILAISRNKSVRVVVISANGKDFSTGLDIKSLMQSKSGLFRLGRKLLPWQSNLAQRMSTGWQKIQCPVIAAIQGRCWGAGLQLALGADIRIAAPGALLSVMETKWGLIPDMGGSLALANLVGRDRAYLITALAEIVFAPDALQLGLVTQIADSPREEALALAKKLAQVSPDALAATKRLYQKAFSYQNPFQLAREFCYQFRLLMGPNRKVAVQNATQNGKHSAKHRFRNANDW